MKRNVLMLAALLCAAALLTQLPAQPPPGRAAEGKDRPKAAAKSSLVDRMMAFDKNKDGKLTRDEITDERLLRLFEQADTNKDGVVTREELEALAKKLAAEDEDDGPGRGRRGRGPGDRPGRGPGAEDREPGDRPPPPPDRGPGDRGRGDRGPGPGGRGPGGPPPKPGTILPSFLQERLGLTADQKKQLEALQKDVDGKLAKILTEDQKKQLKEMAERGPGGRGPGGRGPDDRGPARPPRDD